MTCKFPLITAEDLRARWPDMPPGSDKHAEQLLSDAGVLIQTAAPHWDTLSEQAIIMVACAMVKRGMVSQPFVDGASSISQTAGPFNQQISFTNPNGSLYLSKLEKRLLGIGRQKATAYDMLTGEVG